MLLPSNYCSKLGKEAPDWSTDFCWELVSSFRLNRFPAVRRRVHLFDRKAANDHIGTFNFQLSAADTLNMTWGRSCAFRKIMSTAFVKRSFVTISYFSLSSSGSFC